MSRKLIKGMVCAAFLSVAVVFAVYTAPVMAADEAAVAQTADQQITNQTCPVMKGNKIDPDVYTEYKGKKVYFCCPSCIDAFKANPEKYLPLLPQFAQETASAASATAQTMATDTHSSGEEMETHGHSDLAKWIVPAGIATFAVLVLTVLMGYYRRKNPKFMLKWHKILGVVVLLLAAIHAALVILHD